MKPVKPSATKAKKFTTYSDLQQRQVVFKQRRECYTKTYTTGA